MTLVDTSGTSKLELVTTEAKRSMWFAIIVILWYKMSQFNTLFNIESSTNEFRRMTGLTGLVVCGLMYNLILKYSMN